MAFRNVRLVMLLFCTSSLPRADSPPLLLEANSDGLHHVDVAPQVAALGKAPVAAVGLNVPQVHVVDLVRVVFGDGQDVIGAGCDEAADTQGQSVLQGGIESWERTGQSGIGLV